MQDGDIVADGAEPAERNGNRLTAAELFVDVSRSLSRRKLLCRLAYQPHFPDVRAAGIVAEHDLHRRCDAHRSDTHGVNDSAPVEVRLIVVDRIAVLLAAEMRIYIRKASNAAVSINIESVDTFTVCGKRITAGMEQCRFRS